MFVWTKKLAALTPPFRGDGVPLPAAKIDGVTLLAPVPTSLAPLRAPTYRPRASIVTLCETGEGSPADEADALVILGSTGVKGEFAGSITMVGEPECAKVTNAAVDRWVQRYGIVGALDIFALLGAWRPYDLMSGHIQTMHLALQRLRVHLAHAADYDAALARAPQLELAQWEHARAQVLAYLFPDHRPFFDAALASARKLERRPNLLLACVLTAGDVAALASAPDFAWGAEALAIPRSLRDGGLPILVTRARTRPSDGVALALSAYASKDAAAAMADHLPVREAHKTIAAYFKAQPTLASAALKPHLKTTSPGAAKLVDKILHSS